MTIDAIKNKLVFVVQKIKSFFPEVLPQGQQEFDKWLDDIQALYKLPTTVRSDLIHVFSTVIINLEPLKDKVSKYYFVKAIRNAAAKQVAGARFYELQMEKKQAQMDAQKAAMTKPVEATTNTQVVASSGSAATQ